MMLSLPQLALMYGQNDFFQVRCPVVASPLHQQSLNHSLRPSGAAPCDAYTRGATARHAWRLRRPVSGQSSRMAVLRLLVLTTPWLHRCCTRRLPWTRRAEASRAWRTTATGRRRMMIIRLMVRPMCATFYIEGCLVMLSLDMYSWCTDGDSTATSFVPTPETGCGHGPVHAKNLCKFCYDRYYRLIVRKSR
jgi:hypothetical protein